MSRRPGEKIVFPGIDATVQVVGVKGAVVRLGVEAPAEVVVHRAEVLARLGEQAEAAGPSAAEARHHVRNRLSAAAVGLALLRRQLAAGLAEDAAGTLARVDEELRAVTGAFAAPAPRPGPARRALLVEDDHNERELLAGFLRMAGVEVAPAGDGAEALEYLKAHPRPDAVLLDMLLPRCDGPTTVRALRDDPAYAGLKIIGVSGHPPERFGIADGPAGVDRWFRKPLDPEKLLAELHREVWASA
jgi:carbon storage regulator CsrA